MILPTSLALSVLLMSASLLGCEGRPLHNAGLKRAPFSSPESKVLKDLNTVGILNPISDFDTLRQHLSYARPLSRWNVELTWNNRDLSPFAYWPSALGGVNTRWQSVFPKSLQALGPNFAVACGSGTSCDDAMARLADKLSVSDFLKKGGTANALSPHEKLSLLAFSSTEEDVHKLVKATKDGTDLRLDESSRFRGGQWWEGVCDDLPVVAALFPQSPGRLVVKGISFDTIDMAGLLSQVVQSYTFKNRAVVFGTRFDGSERGLDRDSGERRDDVNPATLFVALANVARAKDSEIMLAMDGDPGAQVWNQGVESFTMTPGEEISMEQTIELYASLDSSPATRLSNKRNITAGATKFIKFEFKLQSQTGWTRVLQSVLEISGNVIVGGEWLQGPHYDPSANYSNAHPDFLWMLNVSRKNFAEFEATSSEATREILRLYRLATRSQ